MKRMPSLAWNAVGAVVIALVLAACGGNTTTTGPGAVASVTVSPGTSTVTGFGVATST